MSGPDPALSRDARRHFLQALRRALRPIIRLLIRHGIGYAEFAEVARGAYVESAVRDWFDQCPKPTRAQISELTGIAPERVDRYIDDDEALPTAESSLEVGATEVLHRWHTDPRYLGADGTPLELDFVALAGPSFQGLVAEVNPEASPDSVLDELLKAMSVVYSDENRLRVITRYFIWPGEWPYSIEYFGVALADLIRTHEYNFDPVNAENKRLERFVSADQGLPARLLPSFHNFAKERASRFLLELDDWLARFSDTAHEKESPRAEAGVNVFFFVDPPPDPRTLPALVQPAREVAAPEEGPAA